MAPDELDCFRRHLAPAKAYLEFGSGGSTFLAASEGSRKIWSVESDGKWIEKLKEELPIKAAIQDGRLRFYLPELGLGTTVGPWGQLDSQGDRSEWHRYHSEIWRKLHAAELDLVLVDGRFRVSCALQAALHVRPSCSVLIHDFTNRPKYHVVLKFFDVVETVGTLVALRPKEPRDIGKIADKLFVIMNRDRM